MFAEGSPSGVARENAAVGLELLQWSRRWQLNDDSISCRGCGRCQRIADSGYGFSEYHEESCPYRKDAFQCPASSLSQILRKCRTVVWGFDPEDEEF